MDESMSGCSAFDFSQPYEIAFFEAAVTMLEFPQRRIRRTSMEDIADCDNHQMLEINFGCRRYVPLWNPYIFNCRTNDEILVCLKYWLLRVSLQWYQEILPTYARTFENSLDGDMTKLSLVLDQEIRC